MFKQYCTLQREMVSLLKYLHFMEVGNQERYIFECHLKYRLVLGDELKTKSETSFQNFRKELGEFDLADFSFSLYQVGKL